jgi:transcription initiation factor IIE alpha subunit
VSDKFVCPHCGSIVEVPGRTDDANQAVVDSMTREIRLLRETVAQLRGVRAG